MAAPAKAIQGREGFSKAYIHYALILLMVVNLFNYLDRQIVMILAEPIKRDLGMSDAEMGIMTGLSFAIFYTVLGLPLAQLADRRNRAYIIGGSIAVWSLFTVMCGQARTATQLILMRIGVGMGEAGCAPASQALIVDMTPKDKRATALSVFNAGANLGILSGMIIGGFIASAYGWRQAFLVAGVPGILLAILVVTTLKEPRNYQTMNESRDNENIISLKETLKYLLGIKTYWIIAASFSIKIMIGYGFGAFIAAFFLRAHEVELATLGTEFGMAPLAVLGLFMGLTAGFAGVGGAVLGGLLADRYGKHDIGNYLSVAALSILGSIPLICLMLFSGSVLVALLFQTLQAILVAMTTAPSWAAINSIVPARMRASVTAVTLLITNLVGLGLGPLALGALSDYLNTGLGLGSQDGLRWAIAIFTLFGIVPFFGYWMARKHLSQHEID